MAGVGEGKYELLRKLGHGGMGDVWEAVDLAMDRRVAVKLLREDHMADKQMGERFLRECRLTGRLQHPNVIRAYSCGWDRLDGRAVMYLVMELLDGMSLAGRMNRQTDRRLSVRETIRWGVQICRGLEAAHAKGLVHRDLKPDNVQITDEGSAVILDFGIACLQEDELGHTRITEKGWIVGTREYMSPEQIRGEPADQRSDLYALGCLLYEMLIGRPPFMGVDVAQDHQYKMPVAPGARRPDIPEDLEELILDLLEKRPEKRPASAAQTRRRLREAAAPRTEQRFHDPGPGPGPSAPSSPRPSPPSPPSPPFPSPVPPAPVRGLRTRQWYEVSGASLVSGLGTFGLLLGAGDISVGPSAIWGALCAVGLFVAGAVSNHAGPSVDPDEVVPSCLLALGIFASLAGCVWLMAARGHFPWYFDLLIGLGLCGGMGLLAAGAWGVGDETGRSPGAGVMALLNTTLLTLLGSMLFAAHRHLVWWTTVLTGLGLWAAGLALTLAAYKLADY